MAKKKKARKENTLVTEAKAVYSGYKDKFLQMLTVFIEEQLSNLVEVAKNMVHLREKIRHFVTAAILGMVGLVVALLGVAGLVAEWLSVSEAGVQLGLGLVVVLAGVVMYKMG